MRIPVLVAALICLLVAVVIVPGLAAQLAQYPGAIRSQVTLVPVNVTVTDRNNKPVTDLKQEDFTVLEDGVPQTIGHFVLQRMMPAVPTPSPDAAPGARSEIGQLWKVPTASLTPQTRRVFVIVLGRFAHPGVSKGLDDLTRFVRKDLLPQDLVAVMAWNRATDFSTDREMTARVLERYKKGRQSIDAKLRLRFSGDAAVYGSTGVPANLQAEVDAVFGAPGAVNARHLAPGGPEDLAKLAERNRRTAETVQQQEVARQQQEVAKQIADAEARRRPRNPDEASAARAEPAVDRCFAGLDTDNNCDLPYHEYVALSAQTTQELENLYRAVEYLRYVDGEKHLLFLSEEGLFVPRMEHDLSLAAMANDARVTIETFQASQGVDTGSLPSSEFSTTSSMAGFVSGDRTSAGAGPGGIQANVQNQGGAFARMWGLQSLRNISELTGGRSSFRGAVSQGLDALNSATRVEYVLGFYPSNASWDGKYRRITVKVNRPGLRVTYRHGYYARQSLQPYDRKAFLTYSRIVAAASYDQPIRDIAVKAEASPMPIVAGQPQQMKLEILIDPKRLPFRTENRAHKATLDVTVFFGGAASGSLGDTWRTLQLSVPEASWEQAQKDGILYSLRLPAVKRGDLYKVIVYSYDADLVGTADATIKR